MFQRKLNPWLSIVKKQHRTVVAEGKLSEGKAMAEALKRAKKIFIKAKRGGASVYAAGLGGRKIRSKGKGLGLGYGKGKGPIGRK